MKQITDNKLKWKTRLGAFVKLYGPKELAEELSKRTKTQITKGAVYRWIYGKTEIPLKSANGIIKIAKGQLDMDDLLYHVKLTRRLPVRAVRKAVA